MALTGGAYDGCFTAADVTELVRRAGDAACIGSDMPLGPAAGGVRPGDREARKFVGARWQSVFLTPPAEVIEERDFAAANASCRALTGSGLSQQSFALFPNIRALEAAARDEPRLTECHPEVSFRELHGEQLAWSKTTWNGFNLRRELLRSAGVELPDRLDDQAGRAPIVDLLDAAVVAWSADRVARGDAVPIPAGAPPGARGTIWR